MKGATDRQRVKPTGPSPQPLKLTPPIWIALALVAAIGVMRWIGDHEGVSTLDYLQNDEIVIIRSRGEPHFFPSLGIEITPPDGWSYLSVTDDARADQPVFVNESTNAIISLRRFRFRSWPLMERPLMTRKHGDITIEWLEVDHRRIGRLTKGDVDLTMVVMSHRRRSPIDESIDHFCRSIHVVSDAPDR